MTWITGIVGLHGGALIASDVRVTYGNQHWDGLQKVFVPATNALLGMSGLVDFGHAALNALLMRLSADVVSKYGDGYHQLDEKAVLTDEVVREWRSGLPQLFRSKFDPSGADPKKRSRLMLLVGDPVAETQKRLSKEDLTKTGYLVQAPNQMMTFDPTKGPPDATQIRKGMREVPEPDLTRPSTKGYILDSQMSFELEPMLAKVPCSIGSGAGMPEWRRVLEKEAAVLDHPAFAWLPEAAVIGPLSAAIEDAFRARELDSVSAATQFCVLVPPRCARNVPTSCLMRPSDMIATPEQLRARIGAKAAAATAMA